MKRIVLEISKVILLGTLFVCTGLYFGRLHERSVQEKEETVVTVAVVNMDEGSIIGDEKINYGSEICGIPSEQYERASLEAAKNGIYNGTYGAYILIPATFSQSVESINNFPQKAKLTYALNPNLSSDARADVIEGVDSYLSLLKARLYMASNNRGLEVYMSVEGIDKLIQAIKSLQSEMQNITMDMASLQKNVSGTRGWIGNGKEECAQVLLLLTKYCSYLSGREINIAGNVCDNSALSNKSVTGTGQHLDNLINACEAIRDDGTLFDTKKAISMLGM